MKNKRSIGSLIGRLLGWLTPAQVAGKLNGLEIDSQGIVLSCAEIQVIPNGKNFLVKIIPKRSLADWCVNLECISGDTNGQMLPNVSKDIGEDPCFQVHPEHAFPLRLILYPKGDRDIAN